MCHPDFIIMSVLPENIMRNIAEVKLCFAVNMGVVAWDRIETDLPD